MEENPNIHTMAKNYKRILWFLLIPVLSLTYFSKVSAEISHPYQVDEKPQVLFGDSIATSTYQGLENYAQDYVNGFAHFSFTYTHHICCFASYPPMVYVTDVDPQATPAPVVIYQDFVFSLPSNISSFPSDWYLYDIQFDAEGYRVVVKKEGNIEVWNNYSSIPNLTHTMWVSLVNQFPKSNPAGPSSMAFAPVQVTPTEAGCTENCFSNVLFLPGLEASRLYQKKENCQINCEDQLWEPNVPSDVDKLFLDSTGKSVEQFVYTRDVIKETNTPILLGPLGFNIYKSFSILVDGLVSDNSINSWESYAYDWRQGIDDLVLNGTPYEGDTESLISESQNLADSSKSGKVTIIAHSNGGLLAKALIKKLEDLKNANQSDLVDHIDNLVLVASPQIGTPDAFSSILHGYGQSILGGWLMSETQARTLAQNMPSAYGLLPSKKYFEQPGISNLANFASTSPQSFRTIYGSTLDSYAEEKNFLLGLDGRFSPLSTDLTKPIIGNNSLFYQAEGLHDSIDNMTIPSSIKVYEIAGWGRETIAGMTYLNNDIQPIFTHRGDGTVVIQSALYGSGTKYWLDLSNSKLSHKNIMEDPQVLDFIKKIIEKDSSSTLAQSEPVQVGNRLHLSVHSPVTLGVYDNQGNFTGKVCDSVSGDCVVHEDIPGSTYLEFGEGKYVNLGEGNLQKVVLQGTGTGVFTFNWRSVSPEGQVTQSDFINIPVTTQTQAEIVPVNNLPTLNLDVTGDGVKDVTLTPSFVFDPISYLQILKITIDSLDITQNKKDAFYKRVDHIIRLMQNGKIDKVKLKAEKFATALEKVISKTDSKKPKPKKISKTDAQLLLDSINQLLDNLG